MNGLERKQRELVFNYCMGFTSQEDSGKAQELISTNREAAEIYSGIRAVLGPLDSVAPEPCPDALVEQTLSRLMELANSSRERPDQTDVNRQTPNITSLRLAWATFAGRLATAAVFLVAASVFLPALGYVRHNSRLQRCQMQQGSFFQGLGNYISDHDGQAPSVAAAAGAPWWKVGYQGAENHSNTRKIYLLVKTGYVNLDVFVCPGSKHGRVIHKDPEQVRAYQDFPDRLCVTYSFQINCRRTGNGRLICQNVVMSDCNPLFEQLAMDFSKPFILQLNSRSMKLNSGNHSFFGCRRGQNVLFDDGHVKFLRTRLLDRSEDDIFTLQNIRSYRGIEVPSDDKDIFLAP